MLKTAKKSKKKPKKLSPDELALRKLQRRHRREIRSVFTSAGFKRIDAGSDVEFTYEHTTSDFDDIFVLENVVVLTEYTTTKESNINDHVKPKSLLYKKINDNPSEFLKFAEANGLFPSGSLAPKYSFQHAVVIILYCSLRTVNSTTKLQVPDATFFDYSFVRYFRLLVSTVRQSMRHELLAFLGVPHERFGEQAIKTSQSGGLTYAGSVLPESHSKFPDGYKVVSFYVDPKALLERSYVMRRDGWRSGDNLYQRLISKRKIDLIRRYLHEHKRVFVNNVILTLSEATKILNDEGNTVDPKTIVKTSAANIHIPNDFNSIGVVDGQHRIFAYYEGGPHETTIEILREQQNLLATGIIYPSSATDEERARFEANLFLEINSTQASAKASLKQSIMLIIRPFSTDAIARAVLNAMNEGNGPLAGMFERQSFEVGKIRTTSVVSYGLKPLTRPYAGAPLFDNWADAEKLTFILAENDAARQRYTLYCAKQIDQFLAGARANLSGESWDIYRKGETSILTPTVINGLIGCMRQVAESGQSVDFANAKDKFLDLKSFNLQSYRSSQYTKMATDLFLKFFK